MNILIRFFAGPLSACELAAKLRRSSLLNRALLAAATLLSAFALVGNAAADTPAAASYAGGNGTAGDPFQISTLAELRKFMESSAAFPQQANYKLTANIDASDTNTWLSGAGWQPVDATLMTTFDGQTFAIQNLFINRPALDEVGFFKVIGGLCCGEVKNIRLIGGQIMGRDTVGALVGTASSFTPITNCYSTATVSGRAEVGGLAGVVGGTSVTGSSTGGSVTGTSNFVGGLIGKALGTTVASTSATGHVTGLMATGGLIGTFVQGGAPSLTNSWATGNVDGDDRVGGLIGESAGKVTFSYATGMVTATGNVASVSGYAFVGGLIGIQDFHATEDSWASGAVSGPRSGVGGLIGSNAGPILRATTIAGQTVTGGTAAGSVGGLVGDNKGAITSSRSASTVNATGAAVESIGGLVGINAAGSGITNSYATGNVTAANAAKVGGLIGWHTTGIVNSSHAQGNVTGAGNVGGLIGMSTTPAVNMSYATGSVSGTTMVGGLIGNRGNGTTDTTFATGNVTASGDYAGGLIGFNTGAVKKSYANPGTVSGQNRVGGLAGYNQGTIETSYAIKTVSGATYVGGLVGQSASNSFGIRDCYAKGSVTGSDKIGGLVGRNDAASNIVRCYASGTLPLTGAGSIGGLVADNQAAANANNYWNASTTAQPGIGTGTVTGATGLTNVQMKQQASFVGFVFPAPWLINEAVSEPYLDYAALNVTTTTTALGSNANPSPLGLNVTFTATVTGNVPTGTMLFQDGANPLPGCIAVTVTTSQAQCSISNLAAGNHSFSAVYSGDGLNTGSTSPTVNQNVIAGSLDVDSSNTQTKYDALTDGVLVVRYLFGLTGNALVSGALGPTAMRTDPILMKNYLDGIRPLLDIDGDGNAYALTDGLLIIRYLLGLSGNALISGAVNTQNGTRTMAPAIQSYLQSLMP